MMELRAEIAGVVVDVVGEQGVDVAEGDPVVIMEAMKMEIPVVAPRAGRILAIRVGKGDTVQEDDLLATIAPV